MTWAQQRESDFREMHSEWPESVTRNGLTADCIKTPNVVNRLMQPASYLTNVQTTVSMLADEFFRLSLSGTRVQFQIRGINYEVIRVRDDSPADPIVDMDAVKTV